MVRLDFSVVHAELLSEGVCVRRQKGAVNGRGDLMGAWEKAKSLVLERCCSCGVYMYTPIIDALYRYEEERVILNESSSFKRRAQSAISYHKRSHAVDRDHMPMLRCQNIIVHKSYKGNL